MGRRAVLNAKKRNRRILLVSVVAVIIALVVVLAVLVEISQEDPGAKYIGLPVSSGIMSQVTGVSGTTLSTVGVPSGVGLPQAISGSSLTLNGKPELLYVGGEYCPYCAVERWSLIIALSHFGNFSGLEYMQSSSTDVNANTPTFTFVNSTYSSQYVSFVPIEEFDRSGNTINPLSSAEQSLVTQYDSSGSIPFIDIANAYSVVGVQTSLDISGQNWTAIASQLNTPSSQVAQQIDGAANTLITAICKIDGGQPGSVCTQGYATVTLGYGTAAQATQTTALLIATGSLEDRWTT